MNISDFLSLATPVLQVTCLLVVLWLCLPSLAQAIRPRHHPCGVLGGPEDLDPAVNDGVPEAVYKELVALGFSPLGIYWERGFGLTFREYAFASTDYQCFAMVYRLFVGEQPRVAFLTVFTSGAAAYTPNYLGGIVADEPDYRAGGVAAGTLAEVLDEHRRRVEKFTGEGHVPMVGDRLDDVLEAQRALYANRAVARRVRYGSFLLGAGTLAVLGGIFGKVAFEFGVNHPFTWVVLLAECGSMILFRLYGPHESPALRGQARQERVASGNEEGQPVDDGVPSETGVSGYNHR
jgi:hypothetical protein